jgi:hypothetical protein
MSASGSASSKQFGDIAVSVVHSARIHFAPFFEPEQDWVTSDTSLDAQDRGVLIVPGNLDVDGGFIFRLCSVGIWPV